MSHPSSPVLNSARPTLNRAVWTTLACLMGVFVGLASSGLAVLAVADHFALSESNLQIMRLTANSQAAHLLLLASALVSGVLLSAICFARFVETARIAHALAAEQRAFAVSVLSENFLKGITDRLASAASAHPLCSVVLVSIDNFDTYLQAHGRKTADAILDTVACALHGGVRASDVVGRVGYDGFAVVLAVGERDVALRASGRLHKAIQDIAIPLANNGTLRLSASLGVAVRTADEAMETTFERAHAALQQALRDDNVKVRLAEAPTMTESATVIAS